MFKYSKRAYQDDESDEDKESNGLFESTKKRKKVNSTSQSKKKIAPVKVAPARKVIDVDSGSDSDSCVIVEKQVQAKSAVSQLLASIEAPINEDFSYDIIEDENFKKANELLSKIDKANRKFSSQDDDDVNIIIVPPVLSTLVLPTVRARTAAEKLSAKTESSAESLLGTLFASYSSPSTKARSDPAVVDAPGFRIITRLNGKHEGRFKLSSTDTFSKLREGLGKLYDLKTTIIKLRFDGEILNDRTTLEDLDIEDDFMIDVLIPQGMYDAAVSASERAHDRRAAAEPSRVAVCPNPVASSRRVSAPAVVNNDVNEQMTIHIVVPACLTVSKATSAEFDIKVFLRQTLQSLHDVLLKQPTLSLQNNVCYALSTNLGEDLDMERTFKEQSVAPEARLIMRFKPMLILFLINGFMHPQTKEPITEPLTVKLRGDTLFGKVMQSMAKYVAEKVDKLSFYFEGKHLDGMKTISLTMLGVTDASEIEIRRR